MREVVEGDWMGSLVRRFTVVAVGIVVVLIAGVFVPSVGSVLAASAPTVTSPTLASITATTATLGGNVTSDGG
jgi:hypothetical protein